MIRWILFALAFAATLAAQTFIQMSDPQFGMYADNKGFEHETANFEFAVATANRLKPAFVVMTGDLVNAPGDEAQIAAFCSRDYGVTFPMFAKIEVNGENAHPLYAHLKKEAPGLLGTQAIKWNFTKFLVDRNGRVTKRFAPNDAPEAIRADVAALVGAG